MLDKHQPQSHREGGCVLQAHPAKHCGTPSFFWQLLYPDHKTCQVPSGGVATFDVTLGLNKFYDHHRRRPELNSSVCMHTMPSNLCWLSVESFSSKQLLDGCAQQCLQHCSGLEYLILPRYQHPKGELLAWVKAARHLRVSDYDLEDVLRSDFEY